MEDLANTYYLVCLNDPKLTLLTFPEVAETVSAYHDTNLSDDDNNEVVFNELEILVDDCLEECVDYLVNWTIPEEITRDQLHWHTKQYCQSRKYPYTILRADVETLSDDYERHLFLDRFIEEEPIETSDESSEE